MFKKILGEKSSPWDARRFRRLRTSYLVKYQIGVKGTIRVTNLIDVGEGGFRFVALEKIPESSLLNVSIYMPPFDRSVEAIAKVIRLRKATEEPVYYVAAAFIDLRREDREAIRRFASFIAKQKNVPYLIDREDILPRRRKR